MAVTVVTPVSLVTGTASADAKIAGGTAINAANTMTVTYPKEGRLLLAINNTFAGAKVVTIAASDVFLSAGQGALAVSVGQDEVKYLIVESSRHKQSDGNISISFAAATTGFVQAFQLP